MFLQRRCSGSQCEWLCSSGEAVAEFATLFSSWKRYLCLNRDFLIILSYFFFHLSPLKWGFPLLSLHIVMGIVCFFFQVILWQKVLFFACSLWPKQFGGANKSWGTSHLCPGITFTVFSFLRGEGLCLTFLHTASLQGNPNSFSVVGKSSCREPCPDYLVNACLWDGRSAAAREERQ